MKYELDLTCLPTLGKGTNQWMQMKYELDLTCLPTLGKGTNQWFNAV